MNYNEDEVKLIRLIFNNYELRRQFLSLEYYDLLDDTLSSIVKSVSKISYFNGTTIDCKYVFEKSESLKINSFTFSLLVDDISKVHPTDSDFWLIIDKLKTERTKEKVVPILMKEYEQLINSSSELQVNSCLSRLRNSLTDGFDSVKNEDRTEDDIQNIRDRIKVYKGEKDSGQRRFLTGYESMDNAIGGFATSELAVFMGASGVGKTTLLLNIAFQLWLESKVNIHFHSFEMPKEQVMRRVDARMFRIDSNLLRSGEHTEFDEKIVNFVNAAENIFKVFDSPPYSSVYEIEEIFLSSDIKPDVLVLDYIGLMGSKSKRAQKWEMLDEIALMLKYMAKRYKICVITASQINAEAEKRMVSNRDDTTFRNYDMAGSKAIAHHSDIICGVTYDKSLKIMNFNSPKMRDMAQFSFQMFCDQPKCYLYDIK